MSSDTQLIHSAAAKTITAASCCGLAVLVLGCCLMCVKVQADCFWCVAQYQARWRGAVARHVDAVMLQTSTVNT